MKHNETMELVGKAKEKYEKGIIKDFLEDKLIPVHTFEKLYKGEL